jgi:hypothetical protein
MNTHTPDFGTITNFEGDETTIALMGTFKNGAAFELGAVLDAAIDRQPASMVLDAAELDFMGPAELLAVSNAERRLASFGSKLTIRSPSALVNRLLDIMELAELSRLERALPDRGHLGPEQRGELPVVFRQPHGDNSRISGGPPPCPLTPT